jgi:hypothetical protein
VGLVVHDHVTQFFFIFFIFLPMFWPLYVLKEKCLEGGKKILVTDVGLIEFYFFSN